MWGKPERVIALGLGSGLLRPGPGTWGTVFGWLSYSIFLLLLGAIENILGTPPNDWILHVGSWGVLLLAFWIGCVLCDRVARDLGQEDPSCIVWDEIVATWFILYCIPPQDGNAILALIGFRFLDIVKPPPISTIENRFRNGFGIMLDDMLTAGIVVWIVSLIPVGAG